MTRKKGRRKPNNGQLKTIESKRRNSGNKRCKNGKKKHFSFWFELVQLFSLLLPPFLLTFLFSFIWFGHSMSFGSYNFAHRFINSFSFESFYFAFCHCLFSASRSHALRILPELNYYVFKLSPFSVALWEKFSRFMKKKRQKRKNKPTTMLG